MTQQYVLHVTSPVSLLTQTHILYSTHCLFALVVNYINYNYASLPSSAVAEPQCIQLPRGEGII